MRRFTPLLFFASVAAIVSWPLVANLTSRLAAEYGPGDPFLNLWVLGWDLKAISAHPGWLVTGRVFDASIFYPSNGTLAYSDHQLIQALAVWPLYLATGNLTLCYNAVFLVSLIVSAWAMFGFIRSVTGSAAAAYCAGLIWGFCPFHFTHLIHIQLQSLYWMPLTFWLLHRLVAGRRIRDAAWLGVVFALQAVSSVYYGVIGAVGVIAAAAVVVTRTGGWSPRLLWRFVLAAVVAVVVGAPGWWPYWQVQQREGFARTLYETENHSATLASYLQAPPTNLVHGRTGWLHSIREASGLPTNEGPEQGLFPGILVLALAALGLVRARKAGMRLLATSMATVGAAGFLLSFGPRGLRTLYAALYEWVFGFQAIRAPARFSVLVFFALAVLAGIGLASLVRRESRAGSVGPTFRSGAQDVTPEKVARSFSSGLIRDSLWPAALVLLLVVVEVSNGGIRYAPAPALTTSIGRWLRDAPESGPVVYFPIGTDRDDSAAMVAALEHGRPIVNGHSGQRPALYLALVDQLATFPDSLALLTLREIGVRFVVARARLPPSALPAASPLVERAAFDDGVIYELRWTPEITAAFEEAEDVGRVALLPPGPLPFQTGESPLALDFHAPVLVNDAGRNTTVDVKVLGEESITINGRSYETWKLEPTLVTRLAVARAASRHSLGEPRQPEGSAAHQGVGDFRHRRRRTGRLPRMVRFVMLWVWVALVGVIPVRPMAPAAANAQQPPQRQIGGLVTDASTKTPIEGATVTIGVEKSITDRAGRFSMRVPPDQMTIEVTATDYFPASTTLDAGEQDILDAQFSLVPNFPFSASVEVVAAPVSGAPATVTVPPSAVLRTPGALDNVFRTLQTLPGISATEEFGSRLAVRGGSPDQNLTVMDGVEVHDPYRLFGLTSAFNPETIQRFDLAAGGFSVKYGDRLSSLLLVDNRNGDRRRQLAGSASLSITDANVVLEGALPRGASGSWLVTGRRTYYDLVAEHVADQQFPAFADVQAKVAWDLTPGRTISFFGLSSREDAALSIDDDSARGEFKDDTRNDLAWARFDASVGATAQSHTVVSYSNTTSRLGVDAAIANHAERSNTPEADAVATANVAFDRQLAIRDIALRQELAWARGSHVVEAGAELHRLSTELTSVISGDRNPTAANGSSRQGGAGLPDSLASAQTLTRGGGWVLDRWQLHPRASVEAGIRVDRSGFPHDTNLSPRASALVSIAPRMRLRGAVGLYTQGPGYEKLAQSDYVLDITSASAGALRSERATLGSIGVEHDLGRGAVVRLEGYYKWSTDLLIGRLEPDADRLARIARYDFPAEYAASVPTDAIITTVPTNDGRGRAYGFDVFVSRPSAPANTRVSRIQGWASYTWGRADRDAYGRLYPFEYDRRHAFSAVGGYQLSRRWELASTIRAASGFPRTLPLGVRVAGVDDTNDLDGDAITDEVLPKRDNSGLPVYVVNLGGVSNLNTGRLPMFARLDVRATWRPRGPSGRWEFYFEVINALNRKNAGTLDPQLEYDPTSDRPQIVEKPDQSIPRLPTIGIRVKW